MTTGLFPEPDLVLAEGIELVSSRLPHVKIQRSEVLKRRGNSCVLAMFAGDGCPVAVAKLSRADTVAIEDRLLAWLGTSPLPTVRTYGAVPAKASGLAWLISEFASGTPFDSHEPEHRRVAAAWLADLHAWAATASRPSLPFRGVDYHLDVVKAAHAVLTEAGESGSHLTSDEREAVRTLADLSARLRDQWNAAVRVIEPLPTTVVHSGIAGKNVRLVESPQGMSVLAFDWEQGGWGCPVADLANVDLGTYFRRMSGRGIVLSELEKVGVVGYALWCLAGVPGERVNLLGTWPHRAASKISYYVQHVYAAVDVLGEGEQPS